MEWEYWVEEVSSGSSKDDIEKNLFELGCGGWELSGSVTLPDDPRINNGAVHTYLFFKKARES